MKNYLMKRYDLTNKEGYKIAIQDFRLITFAAVSLCLWAILNPKAETNRGRTYQTRKIERSKRNGNHYGGSHRIASRCADKRCKYQNGNR